eukprot:gene1463-2793_t
MEGAAAGVGVPTCAPASDKSLSDAEDDMHAEYNKEIARRMCGHGFTPVPYMHSAGMMFHTPPGWTVTVGSMPQGPADVDRLAAAGITMILCLQEDRDIQHWRVNLQSIQLRAQQLGIAHTREPLPDFDAEVLRKRLPYAVRHLAAALDQGSCASGSPPKAFVHCNAGLGRSPAVALAYRFWCNRTPLDTALAELLAVRPCHPQ